jgi:hypothetical protein
VIEPCSSISKSDRNVNSDSVPNTVWASSAVQSGAVSGVVSSSSKIETSSVNELLSEEDSKEKLFGVSASDWSSPWSTRRVLASYEAWVSLAS